MPWRAPLPLMPWSPAAADALEGARLPLMPLRSPLPLMPCSPLPLMP